MQPILALVILVVMTVVVAVWLVAFVRNPYAAMRSNKPTGAMGGALQEIDRLLAQPSIEHTIETEQQIRRRDDDDVGGE